MKTFFLFLFSIVLFLLGSCSDSTEPETIPEPTEPAITDDYNYNLPIIFHVLYKDETNRLQYISPNRLSQILDIVNGLYKKATQSADMNLTFTLATTDPKGAVLSTPGVEYIKWTEEYPINCENFMNDDTTEGGKGYVKYLWNPNHYINVMVYNFTSDLTSNSTILGISHLPFTTTGSNSLEGLNEIKHAHLELANLSFPYCVSINSLYINEQSTTDIYNTLDVTITLAHELGHYLGLHHVFSEDKLTGETLNDCKDSDYCDDTPSYNKIKYDIDYEYAFQTHQGNTYANLVKRENCDNIKFISRNIMDYSISYSDQFTQDQRNRVRHVLMYSPLIPGPKKVQTDTRTIIHGPLDLPIRVVK